MGLWRRGQAISAPAGGSVLVPQGCIHRPEAEPNAPYERRILYLSPEFLRRAGGSCDLAACFDRAREEFRFVVHPADGTGGAQLAALEHAEREDAFGRELLAQSLLFQFLIGLNRAMADDLLQYAKPAAYDRKIEAILRYLSEHLTEPVSIDDLAARFFVSKYHMMRQFRAQTGYTIHGYLTGKRLMFARAMIAAGTPVLQASEESGFGDYSAFLRAYRKQFGAAPNQEKRANTPQKWENPT
ncbi:MAG: AraC family transcriptional regulator [Oscillospiraceae bacterium]